MTQTCSRFLSLRSRIILLAVSFVGCFILLTYFSSIGLTQNVVDSDTLQKDFQLPNNTQDETPHWLVGSFYTTQNGINAKLLLNNKGVAPLEVRPTIYNLAGQSVEIPPVVVEARSFRFINLQDWAALGGESFQSGSIKLFHTGNDLVLGAQIYLVDEAHSLSFEEKLAELGKFDSRRQEAVWFQPTNQTETVLVLSNTSDAPLTVTARLSKRPQYAGNINTFQLAAHETKVLSLRQDFSDGQQFANSDVVGLSLAHTGAKSDLLARVGIADAMRGYSNLAQFSNPTAGKSSEYQGVGFQIDEIAGEQLTPVIVARNVGTQTATITAKVPYTRTDGTTGTINLPQTNLQAGEMKTLNVQQIIQRALQEQIQIAGLEITYNTPAGSVIVNAHSQTANLNQVFRVPMWDPMNQRSPTGGYPWRIENTSTTKTYIKNITDREQYYVAHLNWENGGEYMLGMKKLLPHQTIEIDIKQLRDNQTPDESGRIIPSYIEKGQLKWSLKRTTEVSPAEEAREALALIGRTEQIDVINGISSNYACQNCCGDSYYDSYVTPSGIEVEVDEQIDFDVYQRDRDCNGVLTPYYKRTWLNGSTSWSSSETSVATMSGSNATAVGAGDTTISATWTDFFSLPGLPCGPYFAEAGEQCPAEKEEPSKSQVKDKEPQMELSPPCGGCESHAIHPRPIAYLSVKPPRITNVTAEPTQDVKRVTQVVGNQNIFHFVTPKGDANSQVTLTAIITPNNQRVLNDIDWEGATESPTNPLQATVPRNSASKNVVKIKYRGTVLKEMRVWVVWATISGSVQSPVSTAVFSQANLRIGSHVSASFASVAVINPASIITDADRPNLSGANTTAPPGGTNAAGQPLSGGANMKWDMSRRIAIRATVPNPPFNPPILVDRTDNFPHNPVIGNDDAGVGDEINNPYTNNGQIESEDEPTRELTLNGGNIGDSYRCQLWFQEFARLEIQGTWYVISESQLWRVDYKMEKQTITERLWNTDVNGDGDLDDIVTEAMLGQDTNGDGDMDDDVGYWVESGSTSANDNAGAPQ